MRALIRSEGGCYLLSLVSIGIGVGLIYLAGDSSWNLLSFVFILAAIVFLFLGMWRKLKKRVSGARRSARNLRSELRSARDSVQRAETGPDLPGRDERDPPR